MADLKGKKYSEDQRSSTHSIGIYNRDFSNYSETFVRRHVNYLNEGKTAIISKKEIKESFDKPAFVFAKKFKYALLTKWHMIGAVEHIFNLDSIFRMLSSDFGDFCRANGIEYILAEFGPRGLEIYRLCRANDIPMFCYFRGFDASAMLKQKAYVAETRKMMPQIAGVFCVSEFLRNKLEEVGIEHPNSHIIPSGVDTEKFSPAQKEAGLILAVGRFIPKKDPIGLIHAFDRAAKKNTKLRLEMIGDGQLLEECRALVEELGLQDSVTFHGQRDHAFIAERLSVAEILIQNSRTSESGDSEGLPSALQEALASGAAVISSDHAGAPELISHGVNGFLFREGDVSDLAERLVAVSREKSIQSVGEQARQFAVEHLDNKILYARTIKVMESTKIRAN